MQRLSQLVEGLSAFFYHRAGHIREVQYRDVRPDDDPYGLWARCVNRYGLALYTDHFRSGVIPAGFSWINDGTFLGTPGTLEYSREGTYMIASTATQPNFLADAIAAYAGRVFVARLRAASVTEIGVRCDDGTDSNYAEIVLDPDNLGAYNVDFRYRAGGGAVTDVPGPLYPASEYVTVYLRSNSTGPRFQGYTIAEDRLANPVTAWDTGVIAWVPARVGIVIRGNGGSFACCDKFYSTFA